ncbi:thioesterase family protein [Cordyceps fumosorosea ARSEF 2679]|uniref:Thioesterase family protein n=1 Tax=Cordyceps fumosorosea (strain ARSEF 2679) TaxID=1081104 RepID=A0A167XJE9_CORFA|nr:thioesterase family protein [Cordyceps fumosorosea ARSEF 2679]OAA65043.1 thioesterase family protein [Cordyceps fumosorosea ARSEF 2679]
MTSDDIKNRKREDYLFILDYRTRWNDNDMYDHMNNSIYNFLFDSAVNAYLIEYCGLFPPTATETPLAVHSHTDFFASIAYPAVAEVGVRVNKLGKSSVTYEVALFERGVEGVKAAGEFVHVMVDRETGRPRAAGMSDRLRTALQRIHKDRPRGSKL